MHDDNMNYNTYNNIPFSGSASSSSDNENTQRMSAARITELADKIKTAYNEMVSATDDMKSVTNLIYAAYRGVGNQELANSVNNIVIKLTETSGWLKSYDQYLRGIVVERYNSSEEATSSVFQELLAGLQNLD